MKILSCFAFTALLLPLMFLVGCKQSDTHKPIQTLDASNLSSDAAVIKSAANMAEKKKSAAPAAALKPVSPPSPPVKVATKQKQEATDTAKETNASSTIALAPKPVAAPVAAKPVQQKPKAAFPTFGPDDPRSGIYLSITGKMARMGDPSGTASDAYKYGKGSHAKALAGVGLPKDKFGLIDWVRIVNEGIIKPRDSLEPGALELPPFNMDVLITAKGDFVNDVLFPHKAHTYWLKCENCHTGIFIMAKGKNHMSMQGIVEGKWCGRCHGKVAFPLTDCNRCHQTPKQTAAETAAKK